MEYRNLVMRTTEFQKDSLNSLSPYIGRLRPECAQFLIEEYATADLPIFDPFCGSGTILLQGWKNGFDVYGNDLNPYAYVLSLGKVHPYTSSMRLNNIPSGTIITSPPYMRSLTYARDNRLRLWFLGLEDWQLLDNKISPIRNDFIQLMKLSIKKWANYQNSGAKCVLIVGDIEILVAGKRKSIAEFIKEISSKYYFLAHLLKLAVKIFILNTQHRKAITLMIIQVMR